MNVPKCKWKYSSETEALRLLFTAKKIATSQYQHFQYLVLDHLPKNQSANIVYFPRINLSKIINFWTKIRKVKQTTPPVAPKSLVRETSLLLEIHKMIDILDVQVPIKQKEWDKIFPKFWKTVSNFLPYQTKNVIKIFIYPTTIGTHKSFNLVSNKNNTMHIYYRIDSSLDSIVEGIISSLTRNNLQEKYNFTWQETESFKDGLLLETILSEFTQNFRSTLEDSRSDTNYLIASQSERYLSELGFGKLNMWKIANDKIYFNSLLINFLTKIEYKCLYLLTKKLDKTVTYDDFYEILDPSYQGYTTWALAKTIQRIRIKFSQKEIPSHLIKSVRGKGYKLINQQAELKRIKSKIF